MYDIAIIGGGASGLAAAITAKREKPACTIVVAEKNPRILRKLLATGNGRCNLTNEHMTISRFHGEDAGFAAAVLNAFGTAETLAFFNAIGVPPVTLEKGRVYPMSLQAASVADALRFEAERLGILFLTDCTVQTAKGKSGGFTLACAEKQTVRVKRLIVAAGGCAAPDLGAGKSGYDILAGFGHECTTLSPALCALKTEKSIVHGLQGVKVDAAVSLWNGGKCVGQAQDELLFTDQGLSGTVIFELSVLWHENRHALLSAQVDFFPALSPEDLLATLQKRRAQLAHLTMENFTNGLMHKKLGQALCKHAGVEKLSLPVRDLSDKQLAAIARCMKEFIVAVTGAAGFRAAQVTAGGIRTDGFDPETMESRLVPGLFACGEVLDIHGDCGGFNLQWAWASGYAAGRAAARRA